MNMHSQFDMSTHGTQQRQLPANLEAEQALLGALLLNNAALDAIRLPLEADHFFEGVHGRIFNVIVESVRKGRAATTITIKNGLDEAMIGDKTTAQYVSALATNAVNLVNVPDFAYSIMDCAARRAVISIGQKMEDAAFSTEMEIMDEIEALRGRLDDVLRALSGGSQAKTLAEGAKAALDATADAYRNKGSIGIDYGLPFLMQLIGPLMPGHLVVVGGAVKQGKTSLVEQIIFGAAYRGHPIWLYSGEMQVEELAQRALARLTEVQAWRQAMGTISEIEYEQLERARKNAERWQELVFVRDDTMTLPQIERDQRAFAKRYPNGLAVVDKIDLIERDRDTARMTDTEFGPLVTKRLKSIGRKTRLPQLAVAPFKKNTFQVDERKMTESSFASALSRRPKAADIYGNCEKDVDHLIVPFNPMPILKEMEPSEAHSLHPLWEETVRRNKDERTGFDKAEIVLTISRHKPWPQRREALWNGSKTMFVEPHQNDQERMF